MNKPRAMHGYDRNRTCLDGTRTLCGRVTDDVRWTTDERRITCLRCLEKTIRAAVKRARARA